MACDTLIVSCDLMLQKSPAHGVGLIYPQQRVCGLLQANTGAFSLRWMLLMTAVGEHILTCLGRHTPLHTGLLKRVRVVEIESELVLAHVEMRRFSSIMPLFKELDNQECHINTMAEAWEGAGPAAVTWISQQSRQATGSLKLYLDLDTDHTGYGPLWTSPEALRRVRLGQLMGGA